jgi:hypothetical protein
MALGRVSVGLEDVEDIIEDLSNALVTMLENFFPLSLMMRPNKLEHLSLETLSSQVLEFESKARANPIGVPFIHILLG